ncbi:MAG: hypothetical protein JWN70_5247 [Planctomycetaceae bacterium]|nr:hypothetical protein [Planctomycetaceae bacterium]
MLYVLWRLTKFPKQRVAFFKGNDLLASELVPPSNVDLIGECPSYSKIDCDGIDIWCQLKNTEGAWTVSEVLKDNLLLNFIANTYSSDGRNRGWQTELVTTAEIRGRDLGDFATKYELSGGTGDGTNATRLSEIVDEYLKVAATLPERTVPTRSDVLKRACTIIQFFSLQRPISLRTLQAEFRNRLLAAIGDESVADHIEQRLIGEITADTAGGAECAHWYDREWFYRITGLDLEGSKPLDRSISHACNSQVQSQTPDSFDESLFAERADLQIGLTEFIKSSKTCFVIMGRSGTGKSWGLCHWTNFVLRNRARLFLTSGRIQWSSNLQALIAIALRPLTSRAVVSDAELFHKITLPARVSDFGPLVLVIDDIHAPADRIETFRADIARLIEECRSYGIKLVLSCQTERASGLRPFSDIPHELLFHTSDKTPERSPVSDKTTFECKDFSDHELAEAIARRLSPTSFQRSSHKLAAPVFRHIRNPYLLDQLLQDKSGSTIGPSPEDAENYVNSWLGRQILRIRQILMLDCGLDETSAGIAVDTLFLSLWQQRKHGATRPSLEKEIGETLPAFGQRVVDSLLRRGVVSTARFITLAEPQLAAYGFAQWLRSNKTVEDTLVAFSCQTDSDVLASWLRLHRHPSDVAEALVLQSDEWRSPVAHALSRCNADDHTVTAALIGLARHESSLSSDRNAAESLGEFSLRSRVARKWLTTLAVSHDDGDTQVAQHAMWHMMRFVPERVARVVKITVGKLRLTRLSGEDDRRHRRKLARAMRPLRNIETKFAGQIVLDFLSRLRQFAAPAYLKETAREEYPTVLNDPFVKEFDELEAVAAYYADQSLFSHICARLKSDDVIERLRAANGLAALGRAAAVEVGPLLAKAAGTECEPAIASRLMWHLVGYAELAPDVVLEAIGRCPANDWQNYELSATVLSLLEWIVRKGQRQDIPLIPIELLLKDEAGRSRLFDIHLVTLHMYRQTSSNARLQWDRLVSSIEFFDHSRPSLEFYRFRSIAVSRLLTRAGHNGVSDNPTIVRFEIPHGPGAFFHLQLGPWLESHFNKLIDISDVNEIVAPLMTSLLALKKPGPDLHDSWHKNAMFFTTRDSIDVLVRCLNLLPNPVEYLEKLSHDWEALYASRRLLEIGDQSNAVIEFAQAECAKYDNSATPQAAIERAECVIELRKVNSALVPEIKCDSSMARAFLGTGDSAADELSAEIDRLPQKILQQVDRVIRTPTDMQIAFDWVRSARSWRSVALSCIFARCADPEPLKLREKWDILEQMVRLIDSLPPSVERDRWHRTYIRIQSGMRSQGYDSSVESINSALDKSHALAIHIMEADDTQPPKWELIADPRGWWESDTHKRNQYGGVQRGFGTGYHLCGFLPAVRLALAVRFPTSELRDPAAKWMQDRTKSIVLVKTLHQSVRPIDERIADLRLAIAEMPSQAHIHIALGIHLLKAANLDAAHESFSRVLSLSHADVDDRASASYNLACVFAKRNDDRRCQQALLDSAAFKPINKNILAQDPDFERVKNTGWFNGILGDS